MKQKIKLNAAQVIKHMPEKELEQYNIQLEKETDNPPSIPVWFKVFYKEFKDFYKEFKDLKNEIKDFKEYAIKKFDEYDKLFKKHKWTK